MALTNNSFFFFSGGFAFVYEAQDLGSGREYALKVIINDK
jgi:serine/threonine protein kinase